MIFYHDMVAQETYPDIDHSKINAVPGELTSKITITEKTYGADYVMQMQMHWFTNHAL